MNGGRADASTSTEDVKGRPLCLFYFTHPFGVLSPEPPTITTAPPNIARTFVNMEPVSPFWTSSSSQGYDTTSTRPSFDLGNATVHRNPISLVRNYDLDFQRDTFSSSLFSSDLWFSSSASSRNCERRVIPYHRTLPPLELPTRDLPIELDSSDDVWPKKCLNREKFSLPPIELPLSSMSDVLEDKVSVCDSDSVKKYKRVVGVQKHKRKSHLSSVRRMLTCLMRRNVVKVKVLMGYILDDCPTINYCCFVLPLRTGVIIISVIGLFWAAIYIFGFTSAGINVLEDCGLPSFFGKPMRYVHGVCGVLLSAVNVILFLAAVFESDALCEVYIWFMVVFWVVLILSTSAIVCGAIVHGVILFACMYLLVIFLTQVLISFYFTLIVANYRMTLP